MPLSLPSGAADQLRRAGKPQDDSPPPHPLLHPRLPDVGVNLSGVDGFVAQQGLDVHPFRPGVEQVRRVSMAQWVGGDFLLDPGPTSPRPSRLRLVVVLRFQMQVIQKGMTQGREGDAGDQHHHQPATERIQD